MTKKRSWSQRIIHVISEPQTLIRVAMDKYPQAFGKAFYLKVLYSDLFGKKLNLKKPCTFNEKLNWLKLYDRNPLYTTMADKFVVKDYVAQKIGSEYVVPCYGHWSKLEDVNFDALPDKCFFKANHDSIKGVLVDKNKGIPYDKLKELFSYKNLHRNYYWSAREWPYKNIQPLILAEKYLEHDIDKDIIDYKFWCFNGSPIYMYITNKGTNITENFYDMQFNPVDINHGFPRREPEFEKPKGFDMMKKLAGILAGDIPFVRIDFYENDNQVYFGEFTFYDWAGLRPFKTEEMDYRLGELIKLPK